MILLLQLNETSPTAIKQFRLTVKRRLYAFNKEMLGQINESERKIKLQEVFQGVETDYRRLTANFV